jgi:UDP-N-acetyl-2-amino-2-deoxyglucuronate dehydrogenase
MVRSPLQEGKRSPQGCPYTINTRPMEKLRIGIVGPGKVGHLISSALQSIKECAYVAVCGRSAGRTSDFAGKYGLKPYIDVSGMVRGEKLDVVIVCTPHPAHRDPALAAIREGAHVLVEKPFASTLEDCDAMSAAAREHGRKIGVICQRRFYRPSQRIRQAIDEGKIGKPVLGTIEMLGWRDETYYRADAWRGTWEGEGGGLLVNQAPHQLDLLQWYMGEIEELYGNWGNLNHPCIEVEDTALAVLKFRNGGMGSIILSNSQKPGIHCNVHVHGDNGASVGVQTDGGAMFVAGMSGILEPPVLDMWTVPGEEHMLETWIREDSDYFNSHEDFMSFYHREQILDFIGAVAEGKEPLITDRDGRVTVEIFTAIYRSTRDGKPVRWPVLPEKPYDFDGRPHGGPA